MSVRMSADYIPMSADYIPRKECLSGSPRRPRRRFATKGLRRGGREFGPLSFAPRFLNRGRSINRANGLNDLNDLNGTTLAGTLRPKSYPSTVHEVSMD